MKKTPKPFRFTWWDAIFLFIIFFGQLESDNIVTLLFTWLVVKSIIALVVGNRIKKQRGKEGQEPQPHKDSPPEGAQKIIQALANKLIQETRRELKGKMTSNNYATSKKKMESIFAFCLEHHVEIDSVSQQGLFAELKDKYEEMVRKDLLKEEQRIIRERIREEQRVEKERERELQRLEAEQQAIRQALQKALSEVQDEHNDEVARLQEQLQEAELRAMRAQSQAQLTKAGHVYVISNIGSFGEQTFKIGMTRRLEPLDRVQELSNASVPFSFDVHMMISCDDAPRLENALHQELRQYQVNKVNSRKEFFRVDIETIRQAVERNFGVVDYVAHPEALEYYESLNMNDEDFEFVAEQQAQALN